MAAVDEAFASLEDAGRTCEEIATTDYWAKVQATVRCVAGRVLPWKRFAITPFGNEWLELLRQRREAREALEQDEEAVQLKCVLRTRRTTQARKRRWRGDVRAATVEALEAWRARDFTASGRSSRAAQSMPAELSDDLEKPGEEGGMAAQGVGEEHIEYEYSRAVDPQRGGVPRGAGPRLGDD